LKTFLRLLLIVSVLSQIKIIDFDFWHPPIKKNNLLPKGVGKRQK